MGLRLLALVCLVGAAFAGPFQRETGSQCATRCPTPSHPKFSYELGKKYVYEYRGENFITVAGQRKQKATIEGLAEFHILSQCEGVLKLKNVRIQQKLSPQEIEELVQKLEIPVSYAYNNGKIEHVCPSTEDSKQSLNIKKGVISIMINTMTRLDQPEEVKEYDSLGYCETKYSVKYAHGLEITKEKNLKSCTNRHSSITSLITSPYDSPESRIHTLPLFPQEKLVCKQVIEDQIIKEAQCQEYAKIQPLKHRESVIQFEGTIHLSLLNKEPVDMMQARRPSAQETLLYNLEEAQETEANREREAEQLIREMCSKTDGVVDIAVSKDFIKLVTIVKTLTHESLEKIYNSMKDGHLCSSKKVRDIFVDTLPMAGSDAAVKLMVQLLERKEITGLKAKLWPASLALIPHPNQKTVEAVLPLLKMEPSAPVLLGVSAMVHRLCSRENCDSIQAVQQIVSVLNQQLGRKCSSDKNEQIFAALKAFGNIGYLGEAKRNIIACAKDSSKPTRLRLAAVDAFRRSTQKRPQELIDMYAKSDEDYEVRIACLSAVMKQVDEEQLRQIKRVAERESNEQVLGYTSTLIRNMNSTSSQLKKNIRHLLHKIEVNTPKVNYWDNSKNIELSAFSETLNVGAAVEADIIHSPETKIPRSMYSRLDVDVFDKNVNFFEVGVRAEGLEDLVKKLIGLKDKIPKEPSWRFINAQNLIGDTDADVSLFIRTMNTEIFDVAASDLTALGEMIEIAEVMNKLAEGRSSDFSHSFLFMNSKLVIPSVTGRSYSIDMTGSATVGLTATTKVNLLAFPKNSDVHFHFQPSVNVEISTTVGIQSNKYRPDIKLVSRMHTESNMEAKFLIKDGHVATASVSMPSENVVLAKMSTDIIEIDAEHREKRIFERMQTKVDYCFNKLDKPLGVAICGKLEVPKPFITKSFPFIQGVGSAEFAIKKTDARFKSFELTAEMPKHAGPVMKYSASLDTPGSRVSRKFAAELEVREMSRGHKAFSLELTSPFKNAGGRGTYAWRNDLVQGSLELHSATSRLLTANMSTEITKSNSRTVYKPYFEASYSHQKPAIIEGTISVVNGRKQQIYVDLKANRPSTRPLTLKGTIMKEGLFQLTKKADWKLSSDLALQSPLADAQIRSVVEKRAKQSHTISTSFAVDYQRRGMPNHSMKLAASTQKSAGKISTNAQCEITQFPSLNWALNWDIQGETRENIKNDLTLKYGRNFQSNYVNIRHRSRIPVQGRGECSVLVKAPQFNIESELKVSHEYEGGNTPKIYLETDLCYKKDKHLKSLIHINCESRYPLKSNSRFEIEYPEGKFMYWDEIEETRRNNFEGKANMQWEEDKQIELKYRLNQIKDESKLHHELEASLKVPSSNTPIKTKATLKVNERSLNFDGQLRSHRDFEYSLQAFLSQFGVSHINLKAPKIESNLKVSNEDKKKHFDLDLKLKTRRPRRITASIVTELESEKKFEAEVLWDADRRPDRKVFVSTAVEISRRGSQNMFSGMSKLQVTDLVDVSVSQSGVTSFYGEHEASLDATIKNYKPVKVSYRQEIVEGQVKSWIKFSKDNVDRAEIEVEGTLRRNRNEKGIYAKAAIKSFDRSFESFEVSMDHQLSLSGSSTKVKSIMLCQQGSNKIYKAEWTSNLQPHGMEMKALLHTPYKKYEKQAVGIVYRCADNEFSSAFSVETSDNKIFSIISDMKAKNQGISATLSLKSPFDIVRDAKLHLSVDNHRSKKSLLSYIDVNNARITDVECSIAASGSETEVKGQVRIAPVPNVQLQGISFIYLRRGKSVSLTGKADLQSDREISITSEVRRERESISATAALNTPYKTLKSAKLHLAIENHEAKKNLLCYIDANEERKGDVEIRMISSPQGCEVQGRMKTIRNPELSAYMKTEKIGDSAEITAKVLKGTSPLLLTSVSKKTSRSGESSYTMKTESFEKTILDVQLLKEKPGYSLKQFTLKSDGPFTPLSLSIASSRNEQSSLNLEIKACKESQRRTCYVAKTYHKALAGAEDYHLYRKVTIDLEKTTGESKVEPIGSATVLLTIAEHDYRSKVTFQLHEKNVGYEVRVHRRENEDDHCSIDSHFFLPKYTSRVRASVLHNSDRMMVEVEAFPDAGVPTRRLAFELKKEHLHKTNEMTGYIKMITPRMPKPLMITGRIQKEGRYPVRGKMELHYAPTWNKVLTLEASTESVQGLKSITYKLYREDKSLDASVKLMKKQSRGEDMFGYEWQYKSAQSNQKSGGVSIKLSQKKNGKPQNIEIAYFTPSVNVKIQGSSARHPAEASFSIMSKGQKVQEILIKTSESCIDLEVLRSGPFFKGSACFNKTEGEAVKLLSIDAYCHRQKCLDFHVGLDPENPVFVDVTAEWKKEELARSLSELTGLSTLLNDRSLREIEQEIKEHIKQYKREVLMPAYKKASRKIQLLKEEYLRKVKQIAREHSKTLKQHMDVMKQCRDSVVEQLKSLVPWNYINDEVLKPIRQAIECFSEEYFQLIMKHLPQLGQMIWDVTKSQFENCLKKFCVSGTFCHEFFQTYKRYGYQQTKILVQRKITQTRRSLEQKMPKMEFPNFWRYFENYMCWLWSEIECIFEYFSEHSFVRQVVDYSRDMEREWRVKAVEYMDKVMQYLAKLLGQAERDEDFRTAKALVKDAQKKVMKAWRNKEQLTEETWSTMQQSIADGSKKMLKSRFEVKQFAPEQGKIQLRVRNPFGPAQVQVFNNELRALKRKFQEAIPL